MKRVYNKPEIMFEDFTLSTAIAGDCEVKTYLPSNHTCGMKFSDGKIVFMSEMGGCTDRQFPEGVFNGICYHTPTETNNLFNS